MSDIYTVVPVLAFFVLASRSSLVLALGLRRHKRDWFLLLFDDSSLVPLASDQWL